jgi:hypothetical protein
MDQHDVHELANKCLDSEGYMMFVAYLTPSEKEHGGTLVEHHYRRYHFGLEDAKASLQKLRGFIDEELQKLMEQQKQEETEA